MKIVVKKGLDIPIAGKPEGSIQNLPKPQQVALNLEPFDDVRFKVLARAGESVKIGQPLIESKSVPGQMFVSPGSGVISEIRRGHKRQLLDLIIQLDAQESYYELDKLNPATATREELLERFMKGGLFPHIRTLPFNLIPDPQHIPRDIFVTAYQTRPFAPSYELQILGKEAYFQAGLNTLAKLTSGKVHLVYSDTTTCAAFLKAQNVEKHTVIGPHPAGLSSVHVHHIAPVRRADDLVWTLNALDVAIIGKMVVEGRYDPDRIIAIAGNGIIEGKRGFFRARAGHPIQDLVAGRVPNQLPCFISGDPLIGTKVEMEDFLGFEKTCFTVIPENTYREPFHFLRLGTDKYTATRTYLTGHVPPPEEGYAFTTNQHGEERAFIDPHVYDKVMPMRIPTAFLIKAILSEDFELAEQLGLLEVTPEDFALPTFICPSKIEMIDIVQQGLRRHAKEMGH